ncbi:MAG: ATP-dependent 6-phosphofructokinase [Rickettsiales bacterium]|jgi:6-phosphofructokinase 1|nr:ATP-dependent 6-phosphofructokinase [Rickettsiales bacterium]
MKSKKTTFHNPPSAKRIGIITTGGDCSGLNTAIHRVALGAMLRGWTVFGIKDGTDGLTFDSDKVIKFNRNTLPIEVARLSGSMLCNGRSGMENFETAAKAGQHSEFNKRLKKSLESLELDALVLIGGNGSLSLAYRHAEIYSGLQLICMPKTIDRDIPMTDTTIGFSTAVQQLVNFCDQLLLTGRSHHRWFVVQTMGRDTGALALNAGVALGADAILIPEIKFNVNSLIDHINNQPRDYGIILVSEGISLRGHSGRPAEMISRQLSAANIANRAAFPEHTQRAGDTTADDRLLATAMANCALDAIENNETYVMTAVRGGRFKTIPLSDFFDAGDIVSDPKIPNMKVSNEYVQPDDPLLDIAAAMGIYIGETK